MLWKCCTQYASKFGKLSSGQTTGKCQFSFQSQRKAIPKSAQTTAQLHSSDASKVMFKTLQARLQQYVNHELTDVQASFRKGRGTRDQIANIHRIMEKERVPEKHLLLLYWLCQSLWLWKILKEVGIPDHLTCLLRNLYAGQEATVRTGHGTTDWFQIGKGVCQGCILSPWLFNLYAEYILWNAGLDEAQAGIKIARRNINNLRYADDTTLIAESKEELKSMKVKKESDSERGWKVREESKKAGLKQHSENEDHGIRSHFFMANRWGSYENGGRLYFGGLQNHCRWWVQPWN